MTVKPITLKQAMRVLNGKDKVSAVDEVIKLVNQAFATKYTMGHARCGENMGHFYSVQTTPRCEVTPEDCLEIERQFKAAGWKDASVIFWKVTVAVQLEASCHRGWVSHYNGKPVHQCIKNSKPSAATAAVASM